MPTATITGIAAGSYNFLNDGVPGVATVTAATVPSAISDLLATSPADNEIQYMFSAPGDGGSPITSYDIEIDGVISSIGLTLADTLTGQAAGTYDVRVRAVNAIGDGPWSAADSVTVVGAVVDTSSVTFTVASADVASDLVDFPLKLELSDIPSVTWAEINSDGGNLRAYEADGTTEIPMDLVWVDSTNQKGTVFVKRTLSASSDTDVILTATDAANTKPAAASTYGRNAVWSDYEAVVLGPEPTVDRTGSHTPVVDAAFPSGTDVVFELEQSSVMAMNEAHQGLAYHDDHWYVIDTDAIYKYDLKWNLITSATGVVAATGITGANHLSDGTVVNGELIIPVDKYPPSGSYIEHFGRFNLDTLAFISSVDASAQSRLIASCAVNPTDGYLYTVDFDDGSSLPYYDATTFAYVGSLTLSSTVPSPQGIAFLGGKIYINSDQSTNETVEVELDGTVNAAPYYTGLQNTGNWEGLTVKDGSLYMLHDTDGTSSVWRLGEYESNDVIHFEGGGNKIKIDGLGMSQIHTSSLFVDLAGNLGANAALFGLNNNSGNRTSIAMRASSDPDTWDYWDSNNSWATPSPARNEYVGDGYQFAVAYDGSTARKGYLNGQPYGVDTGITATPATDTSLFLEIGARGASSIDEFAGNIRFATLRYEYMSDDWMAAEYENLHGDFYSVTDAPALTEMAYITGDQLAGSTMALDESALTSVTARQWRIVGGADLGTAATQDNTSASGSYVECEITYDGGKTVVTPPAMVYTLMSMAGHNASDQAFLNIMPHSDTTHLAVSDGAWSSSATWKDGITPTAGARVLIPHGRTVTYDMYEFRRLDRVRVDGVLDFARDQSTRMTVETLMVPRGGELIIGTEAAPMPSQYTADITVSNRDYLTSSTIATDINITRDNEIMSRGVIWQGKFSAWGADKDHAIKTAIDGAPMAGDTNLVLAKIPADWQVGDTIVIPGTKVENLISETEERVITAISGGMVSWATPLVYDHDKQNDNSLRTDLQPMIGNITRNIKIHSESNLVPFHQWGHCMGMHMHSVTDLWRVEIYDMGRTVKGDDTPVGHIDSNDDFEYRGASAFVQETLTPVSNRNARYGIHLHFVGFNKAVKDIINNCSIHGNPGWAMVHHGCEALMNKNCVYDYEAVGMVGETGNETGSWSENWVVGSRAKEGGSPKDADAGRYQYGDFARKGYGMYFNGRELNVHDNYAGDNSVNYVWHHRWQTASFTAPIDHNRTELTLQDLSGAEGLSTTMRPVDNPILGFSGNESAGAVVSGLFITKGGPAQGHGWNTQLIDFLSWGYNKTGMEPEYIGQYAIIRADCLPTGSRSQIANGINWGANTFQVAVVNSRFEDCDYGVSFSTGESTDNIPVLDTYDANEPRCTSVGNEYVNCANQLAEHATSAFSHLHEVAAELVEVEPSHDLPFLVGTNAGGSGGYLTDLVTGTLTDSVSSGGKLPKPADEAGVYRSNTSANATARAATFTHSRDNGYYTYGGKLISIFPLYFGDRASGKAVKTWHAIEHTWGTPIGGNNGEYTVSANPPTITGTPSITTTVNTPASIDLTPFISDVDGGTPTVSVSHVRPAHGFVDFTGNTVTYTPDLDFTGTDTFSVWVDDNQGNSTRVDINVDIDVTTAQAIVAGDWTLAQTAGDAVLLTLNGIPDTGGRAIRKVEYTTDGGANWKRLCYKWVAGGHILSTDSSDVALTSSQALADVQLRYVTDRADLIGSDSKTITLD